MPLDDNCSYSEVLIVDTEDEEWLHSVQFTGRHPLSLQRGVEGLLQEHLDRIGLLSEKARDELVNERVVDHVDDKFSEENQESLLDKSMMEKVLQRKSSCMRNLQRA